MPMKVLYGDIWEIADAHLVRAQKPMLCYIVVPTNIGWNREHRAIMGGGLARYAAYQEDPTLLDWYGSQCIANKASTPVMLRGRLVLFPTKTFNSESPWLGWMADSNLSLIIRGLKQLKRLQFPSVPGTFKVLVPLLGCMCGKLEPSVVKPKIVKHLSYSGSPFRLVYDERKKASGKAKCNR